MAWNSLLQAAMFGVQGLLAHLPHAEWILQGKSKGPIFPWSWTCSVTIQGFGSEGCSGPGRAPGRELLCQPHHPSGNANGGNKDKSLEGALPFRGEDWLFPWSWISQGGAGCDILGWFQRTVLSVRGTIQRGSAYCLSEYGAHLGTKLPLDVPDSQRPL